VSRKEEGFTIVEVLIAVIILGVGVMALAGSSAIVTRMIGRGKTSGRSAQMALARFETLRQVARSTATLCTAPAFATGDSVHAGMSEHWEILPTAGNVVRLVTVTVTVPTPRGARTETYNARISCI
jgi:prepilin-type N-terminal cleavage/methylation domain-containing protein